MIGGFSVEGLVGFFVGLCKLLVDFKVGIVSCDFW